MLQLRGEGRGESYVQFRKMLIDITDVDLDYSEVKDFRCNRMGRWVYSSERAIEEDS